MHNQHFGVFWLWMSFMIILIVIDHEVNEQLLSSTTLIPIGPDLTHLNKAVGTGTLSSLYH
jgi:hypothetical protein